MLSKKKTVFLIERIHRDSTILGGVATSLKSAHELSLLHGRIAIPSISYKTLLRRMQNEETVIFYDTNRFEAEDEAKYSPRGDVIRITRTHLV